MASTLIKTTIGITAGTVAVGGGATFAYLNSGNSKEEKKNDAPIQTDTSSVKQKAPKPITDLLREKGLEILGTDNTEVWKANLTKFKKDHETDEPKGEWAFTNWTEVKAKTDDTSDLRGRCTTNSTKTALDETAPLYLSVKKYCTNAKD